MPSEADMNYEKIAGRILASLQLQPGERVLIRYDPSHFRELVVPLRKGIRSVAGVDLGALEYVENAESLETILSDAMIRKMQREAHLKSFSQLLEAVDVYVWLPAAASRDLYDAETEALRNWLKKGGTRRQIHFHWGTGSMMPDGLQGEHNVSLDAMYEDALDISY